MLTTVIIVVVVVVVATAAIVIVVVVVSASPATIVVVVVIVVCSVATIIIVIVVVGTAPATVVVVVVVRAAAIVPPPPLQELAACSTLQCILSKTEHQAAAFKLATVCAAALPFTQNHDANLNTHYPETEVQMSLTAMTLTPAGYLQHEWVKSAP